jgi:hypothetical protein
LTAKDVALDETTQAARVRREMEQMHGAGTAVAAE